MKKFKKIATITLFITINCIYSQSDKKNTKNNILKTSGKVIKNSLLTIPSDFVFIGKELSNDWKKTGYYLAGITGLVLTDKITTRLWHKHVEPTINYSLPDITMINNTSTHKWLLNNNAYISYPIIANYLGAFFSNKERGQYASINALKAIQYSTIITQLGLKTIFGRHRPNRPLSEPAKHPWTNDHLDFFNKREKYLFSSPEGSAFPSLHTTAYFAIAKVFQMEYDNYWIPYSFMSLIYLAEIKEHNHWVSDLVVGGIVGTLIGKSIVLSSWKKRNINGQLKKEKHISFNIVPQYSKDFTGIHIVGVF
ncbi:PAP2 superfamily protein [Lutibacter sp. Hel_I_33_5]|uniref:phosphatase PAP2 family protein n=1 Tax=Lutibacter sp. Hel_I_33_5 TaxID=1566289 RepID=UPI0011A1E0D2|nr:phosphatase PAP2 family protein [Lutibacter sp. Hel_I_33_5]TVZ56096.1 PAP2 superfamily protein [Lutibacter sp. Hel_I_33_5]